MNRQFIYLALLALVTLCAVGPSFAADKAGKASRALEISKSGEKGKAKKATAQMLNEQAKQAEITRKAELKAQIQAAYSSLRQGESYCALQQMWKVRKALRAHGDKKELRRLERVMVLIQRGDEMAARVRLKSLLQR